MVRLMMAIGEKAPKNILLHPDSGMLGHVDAIAGLTAD
jgi:hypothetical protein